MFVYRLVHFRFSSRSGHLNLNSQSECWRGQLDVMSSGTDSLVKTTVRRVLVKSPVQNGMQRRSSTLHRLHLSFLFMVQSVSFYE